MSFSRAQSSEMRKYTTSSDGGPSLYIAGSALAFVLVVALLHPHPLVLPLLSVLLVTAGFVGAAVMWILDRRSKGEGKSTLQDRLLVPGLMIFVGFAAAMMGDPDVALKSLTQVR